MNLSAQFFVAVALAVDAFAVALAVGACLPVCGPAQVLRLSLAFGIFQSGMNLAGWAAGTGFRHAIAAYDHWIAFGLLTLVGVKLVVEATRKNDSCERYRSDPTLGWQLVVLAVATSIDSLAVGLSFSLLNIAILQPAVIIGVIAGIMTTFGMRLGRVLGRAPVIGSRAEIAGGLVLLAIGVNILHEHGVF